MKLFTKANRYFGISVVVTLICSSVFIFFGIQYLFEVEAQEKLEVDEYRLIQLLEQNQQVVSLAPFFYVKKIDASKEKEASVKAVQLYDPIEKESEKYLELSSVRKINDAYYNLKVRHATVESDDLMFVIILSFLGVMFISFILLFFINKSISRKIWIPFYTALANLKSFSIENGIAILATKTNINEFDSLNESLEHFSSKLIQDYKSLQEFTENASHEIQTPLSVVLLNLEEALQKDLDEETSRKIYISYQAALRLSRLNEKLLLLTKLDNQQFSQSEQKDLTIIAQDILLEYIPLFESKSITCTADFKHPFLSSIDHGLATILISNLLTNAFKYSDNNGRIEIYTTENSILISNSTNTQPDVSKLFNRFHKSNMSSDSLGLGLSISKKIASTSQLFIELKLENDKFTVQLSQQ
jgi:signal transduction histidine kinase